MLCVAIGVSCKLQVSAQAAVSLILVDSAKISGKTHVKMEDFGLRRNLMPVCDI